MGPGVTDFGAAEGAINPSPGVGAEATGCGSTAGDGLGGGSGSCATGRGAAGAAGTTGAGATTGAGDATGATAGGGGVTPPIGAPQYLQNLARLSFWPWQREHGNAVTRGIAGPAICTTCAGTIGSPGAAVGPGLDIGPARAGGATPWEGKPTGALTEAGAVARPGAADLGSVPPHTAQKRYRAGLGLAQMGHNEAPPATACSAKSAGAVSG